MTRTQYYKPETIIQALALRMRYGNNSRFLAGGTDVLVNRFQGNDKVGCLIDLTGIAEMKKICEEENVLEIGALVTLEMLERDERVKKYFPALAEAAHAAASPVIRKTATLGGNLLCENRCMFYNQSHSWREAAGYCLKCDLPAGKDGGDTCLATGGKKACFSKFVSDTAPVLIALGAQVVLEGEGETETRPLEKLYTGDGLIPRALEPGKLILSVHVPKNGACCVFRKLRPREAVDFTSLTTAVALYPDGRVRLVAGGVDPGPVWMEGKPPYNKEELIRMLARKCRVVDNDVYSRTYRKEMIPVFLREGWEG